MKFVTTVLTALCAMTVQAATPAEPQAESCEQIRMQIKAQTGVLTNPDLKMLAKVGANKKCRFTAAEAYRAAYGDKPMPKDEPRARRDKQRDGDDD